MCLSNPVHHVVPLDPLPSFLRSSAANILAQSHATNILSLLQRSDLIARLTWLILFLSNPVSPFVFRFHEKFVTFYRLTLPCTDFRESVETFSRKRRFMLTPWAFFLPFFLGKYLWRKGNVMSRRVTYWQYQSGLLLTNQKTKDTQLAPSPRSKSNYFSFPAFSLTLISDCLLLRQIRQLFFFLLQHPWLVVLKAHSRTSPNS